MFSKKKILIGPNLKIYSPRLLRNWIPIYAFHSETNIKHHKIWGYSRVLSPQIGPTPTTLPLSGVITGADDEDRFAPMAF